ncbi:MAG: YggS family pyridoxal phosphate-dependent enzyme [Agriterribacter sp.]
MVNEEAYKNIIGELEQKKVQLIAVSKTKPVEDIFALYALGQKDFGENYVQEIVEKQPQLPIDIRWHFIGHLQSNKVKYIAPFIYMIHGVDSLKLLLEINKQAQKNNRIIPVLLQVYIAKEETKFGLDETELNEVLQHAPTLKNIAIKGLMGMASFTNDKDAVRSEFRSLKSMYDRINNSNTYHLSLTTLSMGMSADYAIAVEEGSTMVRIGSLLFGERK